MSYCEFDGKVIGEEMTKYSIETNCIHGGYKAGKGEPQVPAIVQSTTYRYYDGSDMANLFDLKESGFFYTRVGNPTVGIFEGKMATLEGGVAGVATASGIAAIYSAILNICKKGDHVISSSEIYGGTFNQFKVTFPEQSIDVTFVDQNASLEELKKAVRPNTKVIFAETLSNPGMEILDIEKFKELADFAKAVLIIDNTLATPYLCRPIEHGANIVVNSSTKWIDGHAAAMGGIVVDGGNFNWEEHKDKYPGIVEPDESYHGLKFYETFGNAAYAVKFRVHLLRDLGFIMAPQNAFLSIQGLDTLHLRMERHSENALKIAQFLENHDEVEWVNYPGLKSSKSYELGKKYMPRGCGGVLTFGVKGGSKRAAEVLGNLELTSLVTHVGDIRTSVLHPASTTHRQLNEEEQIKAGVRPEMIRLSVGCERYEDIEADFKNALEK